MANDLLPVDEKNWYVPFGSFNPYFTEKTRTEQLSFFSLFLLSKISGNLLHSPALADMEGTAGVTVAAETQCDALRPRWA